MNNGDLLKTLAADLASAGLAVHAPLMRLAGGRTNIVFRTADLVLKIYRTEQANPLFDNNALHEKKALLALQGTGIAPQFVGLLESQVGQVLVYRHVNGTPWQGNPAPVATLLGRLHRLALPLLPRANASAKSLYETGRELLGGADFPECPPIPDLSPAEPAFIHGDVTANNIIVGGSVLTLIDWQCPRLGDPAEDLAGFLSPAMQVMFGPGLLTTDQAEAFLNAYPDPNISARYRTLAPLYHWRMAAYCLWQVRQGLAEYSKGLQLELAALASYRNSVSA